MIDRVDRTEDIRGTRRWGRTVDALTFEFAGTAADADTLARDLAAWLDDDEELAGSARVRMAPPGAGEQGGLADASELLGAVEPLLSAGIGAFGMWLAERVKSRRISFRAVRPDGAELELSAGSPAEAEAVQERLERFVAGGGTGDRADPGGTDMAGEPARGTPAPGGAAPTSDRTAPDPTSDRTAPDPTSDRTAPDPAPDRGTPALGGAVPITTPAPARRNLAPDHGNVAPDRRNEDPQQADNEGRGRAG
ncbi:hypothetical protein [Streptomyces sp. NPDC051776]|uniref:effector-associated constant component EACC1 n=1 Tax=Streptomyces sp. NPDC051776 TaxID=3155414 RepID=UPI00344040B2